VNNDNRDDLSFYEISGNSRGILLGQRNHSFSYSPSCHSFPGISTINFDIYYSNFNGDRKADMILCDKPGGNVEGIKTAFSIY
jgi:hypothetical protein